MSAKFRFDDPFYPVPQEAIDADPEALVRDLIYRVSSLERAMDEQRTQATAAMRALLLDLVSLADDLGAIVERYGVTSNAREAAIIRSLVGLGRRLIETLRRQGVEPINTLGEFVSTQTSDVVGSEAREGVSDGRVLREVQSGYTWPHGLLRRARVIVSMGGEVDSQTITDAMDQEEARQSGEAHTDAGSAANTIDVPSSDVDGSQGLER